jgi:protein TonB
MPPLRTTGALSVLGLAIGVAGTAWLSAMTTTGYAPRPMFLVAHPAIRQPVRPHATAAQRTPPHHVVTHARRQPIAPGVSTQTAASGDADELVPQVMVMDDSQSWERLRGHLDGQVLLAVRVDGAGRVTDADIAQSSGDELLDAHALRSVRRWRFAVPADHPDGMHGEVPMRFSSGADRASVEP